MTSVLDLIIEKAEHGSNIKIDYDNRTVKIGKKTIIKDGHIIVEKIDNIDITDMPLIDNPISEIDELGELYETFIHSTPTSSRKQYIFKPLSADELSYDDIMRHDNRESCYVKLVLTMMFSALTGSLVWDKPGWFYKIPNTSCIIYKKYLEV